MSPADDWLKQPVYRALLDDVVANPDDDTPRLVIADWLQEHAGAAGDEITSASSESAGA